MLDCGPLTPPANGTVTLTSTKVDSTASYDCDEGFNINEIGSRVCEIDGVWSNIDIATECTSMFGVQEI